MFQLEFRVPNIGLKKVQYQSNWYGARYMFKRTPAQYNCNAVTEFY
jgi:hypothetical protein